MFVADAKVKTQAIEHLPEGTFLHDKAATEP